MSTRGALYDPRVMRPTSALPFVLGSSLVWFCACGLQTSGLGGTGAATSTTSSGTTGGAGGAATTVTSVTTVTTSSTGASTGTTATTSGGAGGSCPTGTKLCSGACKSTGNPAFGCAAAACGACPSSAHETAGCDAKGACTTTCDTGYADCDGKASNGCEVDTTNDPNDCGKCNNACPGPTAQAVCTKGTCALACPAGLADCDGKPANGCETDITTVTNCGACGTACTNANGATACTKGVCAPTCAAGYANCNGNPDDGCETALSSTSDCGTCGRACAPGFTCLNENDDATQPFACGCGANDANCDNGAPSGSYSCDQLTGPDKCKCSGTLCDFGQRCNSSGQCM